MFYYEGYTCPICNEPFQPNDDVVACPQCGLPHHRTCWIQEGQCHLAHLHNTNEQWNREKGANTERISKAPKRESVRDNLPYQICPRCHTKNPEFAEICTHCGMILQENAAWDTNKVNTYNEYRPFRLDVSFRYTDNTNEVIDGVRADELATVVNTKTEYYVPRFSRMSRSGSAVSWNWAAFFFGPYWFLYRKMYKYGTIMFALQLLQTAMTYSAYTALGITSKMNESQITQHLLSIIETNDSARYLLLSISLLSVIMFVLRVFVGLFSNKLYQLHCKKVIRKAREKIPDVAVYEIATFGGTSLTMAFIGSVVNSFITQILAIFLFM